jgi:hypothetical protein
MLMLDTTLAARKYAFGIIADIPPETPSDNTFNLVIRNPDGQVVDAAYGIKGQTINDFPTKDPVFSWTRSEAGQPSVITMGLSFTKDTTSVKALLISFPEGFIHDVQKPTDVQNHNRQFPVSEDWADTGRTNRIKILLDDTKDDTTIAAGSYSFSFPVLVPCCTEAEMPESNIWYLSLCEVQVCWNKEDVSVRVTFPTAGFSLGELAPEEQGNETDAGSQGSFCLALSLLGFALHGLV